MNRPVLPESRIHPAIRDRIANHHRDFIEAVERAVQTHDVVVVGMGWNPFPRKARELLTTAGIAHHSIEHGNYLSGWRRRNALKMWTGWPTFPMIFVKGTLIGGYENLQALNESGELAAAVRGAPALNAPP